VFTLAECGEHRDFGVRGGIVMLFAKEDDVDTAHRLCQSRERYEARGL